MLAIIHSRAPLHYEASEELSWCLCTLCRLSLMEMLQTDKTVRCLRG